MAAASESAWQRRLAGAGPPNGQEVGIVPAKGGGREGTRFERGAIAARIVVGRWQVPVSAVTSALVARLLCSSTCNAIILFFSTLRSKQREGLAAGGAGNLKCS